MPADPTRPKPKRRLSRKDENEFRFDGGHAREVEQKRNRGEISCAECRRLKIKCDKQIPCQSCQRRGCASLCPNSSLETGQGTRFVLAATEHLHDRIAKMSARIRNLEDALADLQAKHSIETHPLLRDKSPRVINAEGDEDPSGADEMGTPTNNPDVIDAFGTLSISDHGSSRFFGPTGGSESLFMTNDTKRRSSLPSSHIDDNDKGSKSPPDAQRFFFSHSFPFTPSGPMSGIQSTIESHLPPVERAYFLCGRFYAEVGWIFRGVPESQVYDDILSSFYRKQDTDSSGGHRTPHDLSLLFSILAIGALMEDARDEAEHYNQIARAAISLQPVLEKPTLETVQTLRLWSIYNGMNDGDETSMELTWSLVTLAAHLSQTIGLHRDSAKWKLSSQMIQRRRVVFWDLFMADIWQSLHTGRPPAFSSGYVDCSFPDPKIVQNQAASIDAEFESWVYRFTSECAAEVVSHTLTAEGPSHATVIDLDRKVREFGFIKTGPLSSSACDASDVGLSIRRLTIVQIREGILLYTHRSFFAQAITDYPTNPLKSMYSRSFMSAYRASSTILQAMQETFSTWPKACSRYWVLWTFTFGASIVFGVVVTRCPVSPLAASAMKELEQACILFTKAATHGRRAAKSLVKPILLRLREKARCALSNARMHATNPKNDQILWNVKQEDPEDELAIFAGRTHLVSTSSTVTPPYPRTPQPTPQTYNSSTFPESQHGETVPTASPTKMWATNQPRNEFIPTPDNYHHFQPEQPYALNVAWSQQHPQENLNTSSFQTNTRAAALYDMASGAGTYREQQQQHAVYTSPSHQAISAQHLSNHELANLGFTTQEGSQFDDRWTSFMRDSGVLEGIDDEFRRHP